MPFLATKIAVAPHHINSPLGASWNSQHFSKILWFANDHCCFKQYWGVYECDTVPADDWTIELAIIIPVVPFIG